MKLTLYSFINIQIVKDVYYLTIEDFDSGFYFDTEKMEVVDKKPTSSFLCITATSENSNLPLPKFRKEDVEEKTFSLSEVKKILNKEKDLLEVYNIKSKFKIEIINECSHKVCKYGSVMNSFNFCVAKCQDKKINFKLNEEGFIEIQ